MEWGWTSWQGGWQLQWLRGGWGPHLSLRLRLPPMTALGEELPMKPPDSLWKPLEGAYEFGWLVYVIFGVCMIPGLPICVQRR